MPDNHNVLLVDGRYTDAQDVNDVYMTSVEQRQKEEGKDFSPESYGGFVSCVKVGKPGPFTGARQQGCIPAICRCRR